MKLLCESLLKMLKRILSFIGWSIASFFFLIALVGLITQTSRIISILSIVWGLIFLPPLYHYLTGRYGWKRNVVGRLAAFFIAPILIIPAIPSSPQAQTPPPLSAKSAVESSVAKPVAVESPKPLPKTEQQEARMTVQEEGSLTTISRQASLLEIDMTYREVVARLGRVPDTVVNDQIREELGETTNDNNLITFEWKNDNPNCHPVSVDFDPSGMALTGVDQGRVCPGSGITTKPFGKACDETTLCRVK
jgi:hypothetical protein